MHSALLGYCDLKLMKLPEVRALLLPVALRRALSCPLP